MPDPVVTEEVVEVPEAEQQQQAASPAPEPQSPEQLFSEGLAEQAGDEPTPAPEATPEAAAPAPKPSRFEKVRTEAEQKIADAEARAKAAEERLQQLEQGATAEQEAERLEKLGKDYSTWIGTADEYAEAQRLSRLDPDSPEWDWEQHRQAVLNLANWDERRRWAGLVGTAAERKQQSQIEQDFLVTLAADLPEDKREAYRTHQGGIPGAVRFYAEQIAAQKVEELEGVIAERDAEIERLRASGGAWRAPAGGGAGASGPAPIDYSRMSPEEMMSLELRQQATASRRRR